MERWGVFVKIWKNFNIWNERLYIDLSQKIKMPETEKLN